MRWLALQAALAAIMLISCAERQPLTTIQARADGHLMMLPTGVQGSQQWFTWDTGAPSLVIDPRLARALKLKVLKADSMTGTGAGSFPMSHSAPVTVTLAGVRYTVDDPWIIDLSGVPVSKAVRGLIGADLWSRYAVRMNSQKMTLELFPPGAYRRERGEAELPLIASNNKMYIDVILDLKPGLSQKERVRIDTGSGDSVNSPLMGKGREVRRSILGNGLGENYESVSGNIEAVHIGPFAVANVWGAGGKGPAIGMEMLRRFVVTFDARAGKIYLKPTAALSEPVPPPPSQ